MSKRLTAVLVVLCGLLSVPAVAAANPAVGVEVVSSTNLTRLPATVVHRLTLTAGATEETVRVSTNGSSVEVGGSAVQAEGTVVSEPLRQCPGRWSAFHAAVDRKLFRSSFRIPAGTTATVTVPVTASAPLYFDETLDAEFELQVGEQKPFVIGSEAPSWSGPAVPDLSLFVIRGANRSTVITGQAPGPGQGRIEVWGIAPRTTKGRLLKTVRVDGQGLWSWAGWRPRQAGRWELYARYRRSATAPRTGATECGLTFTVLGRPQAG